MNEQRVLELTEREFRAARPAAGRPASCIHAGSRESLVWLRIARSICSEAQTNQLKEIGVAAMRRSMTP